jgi:hypothetical protein
VEAVLHLSILLAYFLLGQYRKPACSIREDSYDRGKIVCNNREGRQKIVFLEESQFQAVIEDKAKLAKEALQGINTSY